MRTGKLLGLALLAFIGLVVMAHAGESYEDVVKGMLGTLDDINKVLVGIKDEGTANSARADLKKHGERMLDLRKKAKDLPLPSKDEKDALELKYKGKFEESLKKMRTESVRVKAIPGGDEALKAIAALDEKKKPKE